MLLHLSVELIAGEGIAGDRYSTGQGSYSMFRYSAREPGAKEPGRQITIISADSVDAALSAAGLSPVATPGKSYGDFRRNVVVRGISAEELMRAQGTELCLGPTCRVFVHRHCVPCTYNERLCGRPGQVEAIWDSAGVSCEVLVGGPLSVGDAVTPAPANSAGQKTVQDKGTQPAGYFVRPSKRTTVMVDSAKAQLSAALDGLLTSGDAEGAARAEAAYASVGLGFWPASSAWRPFVAARRRRRLAVGVLGAVVALALALGVSL